MSTQFTNRQWRLPNNENKDKQSNYSMDFDGSSSEEISLGTISQISSGSDFTISLWFKTQHASSYNTIFASGTSSSNDIYIAIDGQKNIEIGVRGQRLIDVATIVNDVWYHFVLTVEGTTYKAYLDNGTPATGSTGTNTSNSGDNAVLGDFSWTGNYHFNGQIDAVSIFDYALSASQVTTLYGSSSTGIGNPMSLSPKPVAYYPLGDQDAFNGASYLTPNSSLKDYVFSFAPNSYINIPDLSSLRVQNLTVSFWVNAGTQGSNYKYFLEKGSFSYVVYTSSTTTDLFFFMYDGSSYYFSNALTNVLDSNWHHITFTYNGSQIIGYKDGVANTPVSASVTLLHDTNPLTIGGRSPSPGNYPTGKISNAQIFNTALPATGSNSVETLYNNGSPLTSMSGFTSLQGWWKLDASATYDGSNWTIPDDSSNSNTGTSSGMTQANLVQSDLSFTSGYSPYALDFDGTNDYINYGNVDALKLGAGDFTWSGWINPDSWTSSFEALYTCLASNGVWIGIDGTNFVLRIVNGSNIIAYSTLPTVNTWTNICITRVSGACTLYYNGVSVATATSTNNFNVNANVNLGGYGTYGNFNGKISNVSIWNAGLTSSQVTEIYSEGIPQNLNNHSAVSSLVSWWQLGSNSSFNTNWTVLDEKGSNNGTSVNMTEDDIVDGVNTYGGGTSSGMGGDEVIGDAPYSSSNSLSVNMDVLDRSTDVPN